MSKRRRSRRWSRERYTRRARDEGYEARSVYKLAEVDRRARLFRRGMRVLDLGCAPGSWSRYALEKVGESGRVVGIDRTEVGPQAGAEFLVGDILNFPPERLSRALGGAADVVLSDMAPNTTGDRIADHFRQIELARAALAVAHQLGDRDSSFVCKVFEGGDAADFVREAREIYVKVRRMRPDAVRKGSREWFLVATGHRDS